MAKHTVTNLWAILNEKYLIRILRKLGILKRITIYPSITIHGKAFKVPIINGEGMCNFNEPWMYFVLDKLLKPSMVFLDFGVNVGQTLIKVKAINRSTHYIGFEPNPFCNYYINELIKVNSFQETTIYPVGIGDNTTIMKLHLFSEFDSSGSIIEGFRDINSRKKSINVPIFRFADLNFPQNIKN